MPPNFSGWKCQKLQIIREIDISQNRNIILENIRVIQWKTELRLLTFVIKVNNDRAILI